MSENHRIWFRIVSTIYCLFNKKTGPWLALFSTYFQIVLLNGNPNLVNDLFFSSPVANTISTSVSVSIATSETKSVTATFILAMT